MDLMLIMNNWNEEEDHVLQKVEAYVKEYMAHYDPSHDWSHIRRVVHLAQQIQAQTPHTNLYKVTLSAMLHDIGDRKYVKPNEDPTCQVRDLLLSFSVNSVLADEIQAICLGVSYSSEIKDPSRVVALIEKYPELAVVQDADRLDAIGAVGAGRCFAFGGARNRDLSDSIRHFEDKLVKLEGMMKTQEGRRLAKDRADRIKLMVEWWKEETQCI